MRLFPHGRVGISRRVVFRVHLWTGLAVGGYALLMGLSGAALVYHAELQARAYPQFFGDPPAGGRLANPTSVEHELRRQYPGRRFTGFDYPTARRHSFRAYVAGGGELRTVFLDPRSGRLLGELPRDGWIQRLHDLHSNLLLGATGYVISGVASASLVVLVLTGFVLWWPGASYWTDSLTVHAGRGWRRVIREFHWVSGFWTAGLLLVWAVSGVYFCFPGPFREAVAAVLPLSASRAPTSALTDVPGGGVPSESLLARAQAFVPGAHVARLFLPSTETASFAVVLARAEHGDFDTSDEVTVYFDRYTGEFLGLDDQSDRSAGDDVMRWLGLLHFGSFGGTPVKLLWLTTGLVFPGLAVTGAVMWWTRRSGNQRRDDL